MSTRCCAPCAITSRSCGSAADRCTDAGGWLSTACPSTLWSRYRLGQRRLNDLVFADVRMNDIEPLARVAVVEAMTATFFQYIDWISDETVAVYEDERER